MPYQYNCQTSNVNLDQQPTVMRPRSRTSEFVRPAPAAITSDARRVTNQPPQSPPPNDDVFCKPDPNIIKVSATYLLAYVCYVYVCIYMCYICVNITYIIYEYMFLRRFIIVITFLLFIY